MKNLLVENRWYFRLLKMCVCYFTPYRVFYPYFIRKSAWEIFAATNRKNTPPKNASIFIGQRKYFRCAMKILALADEDTFIFWGSFLKKNAKEMQNYFLSMVLLKRTMVFSL